MRRAAKKVNKLKPYGGRNLMICALIVFYVIDTHVLSDLIIDTHVLSNLPAVRTTLAEVAQSQMLHDPIWRELGVYPVIQPCPNETDSKKDQ